MKTNNCIEVKKIQKTWISQFPREKFLPLQGLPAAENLQFSDLLQVWKSRIQEKS